MKRIFTCFFSAVCMIIFCGCGDDSVGDTWYHYESDSYVTRYLSYDEIELLECKLPVIKIRVVCSKGTYIRALARDIGQALDSGAHLIGLVRTRVGEVKLEHCMQVEGFAEWLEKQEIETINE